MNKDEVDKIIKSNREFLKHIVYDIPKTDQNSKIKQPSLYKEAISGNKIIPLPKKFANLEIKINFLEIIEERKSDRLYTGEDISLDQLSYLLWTIQGVRGERGAGYTTIRNVPCAGARYEFETYLIVQHVKGLQAGIYHYLAKDHTLEFLKNIDGDMESLAAKAMGGQGWVKKSSVQFFWSIIPYRSEWRSSIKAHRVTLIDIGHVGQNLYLAATALGLGTCGIGVYDQELCDELFNLDSEEQTIYSATIGVNRK